MGGLTLYGILILALIEGERMSFDTKFEKVTLWTAVNTYGSTDGALRGITALDYVIPALQDDPNVTVLDWDTEDYELVKVEPILPEVEGA